ncbi:MAG: integrase arm-type DNA-binding domain-containing protein [Alphaproteobacteria bacterium]|nr:integrase arm-type DNA-binding domain-containing protein [Alphaproteobacteria bacterium]
MLTDLKIKNLKPREKGYKERDGKGLYLFVLPTGGKSWRYDYKLKVDINKYKNRTFNYGPYPAISLAQARNMHTETKKLLVSGIDPNEHKKEQERLKFRNKPVSFEELASEWLEKKQAEIKPKTLKGIKKRLDTDVFPKMEISQ